MPSKLPPKLSSKVAAADAAAASSAAAPSRITTIALVPGEQNIIIAGFDNGQIHRLRRNAAPGDAPLVVLTGHTAAIAGLHAPQSADDVMSCSLDGTVKFWTATTAMPENQRRCTRTIQVGAPVRSMLVSGDNMYLGTTRGTVVRVEGNKVVGELAGGHSDSITAILMADSGALLTTSLDGTVVGWDLGSHTPVYVFKGHSGHIRAAVLSGSNLYTCASDETFVCFPVPSDFTPPAGSDDEGAGDHHHYSPDGAAGGNADYADGQGDGEDAAASPPPPPADATITAAQLAQQQALPASNIHWVIKPSARVALPWLPTSIAMHGNYAIVGTSARLVASINVRALAVRVTEYAARVEASIGAAEKKLRKAAAEKKKAAAREARRAVREFRAAHGDAGGGYASSPDEEGDEGGEDGEGYGGGNGGDGGGAASEEIEEFERQKQQEAADKAVEIDGEVAAAVARFARLRTQFFVQPASQYLASAMCDIVPGIMAESALSVAAEAGKIWAATGSVVETLQLRPRVRAV